MNDYFQSLIANCASEWRPVLGYEGHYEVSMRGEVRSLARVVPTRRPNGRGVSIRGRTLKRVHSKGYNFVCLKIGPRQKTIGIHRLVAEANMGPAKPLMEVDHINGIKDDNRLENLRFTTRKQNRRNCTKSWGKHGHRGVRLFNEGKRRWAACIRQEGKAIHLGVFMTFDEAVAARLAAEESLWGADAPAVVRK